MASIKCFLVLISILLIISVLLGCIGKTPEPSVTFESISNISNGLENPDEAAKSVRGSVT